jgi:hypothetical protein
MTQQQQGAVATLAVERVNNLATDEIQVGHTLLVSNEGKKATCVARIHETSGLVGEDDIVWLDDTYDRESIAR